MPDWESELASAVGDRDLDKVHQLLAAGADPNETDRWDLTPLIKASMSGSVEIVGALLRAGADLEYLDHRYDRTALSVARDQKTLNAILAHRPSQRVKVHAIKHFLHRRSSWAAGCIAETFAPATRPAHLSGIRLVNATQRLWEDDFRNELAVSSDDTIRLYGGVAMTMACAHSAATGETVQSAVTTLLDAGADPDGGGIPSPIAGAVARRDPELLHTLLLAGANPDVDHGQGLTALMIAMGALERYEDRKSPSRSFNPKVDRIAALLIEAGADVNARWAQQTPLSLAVVWRPYNIRRLLEAGADATWTNHDGSGLIHLCSILSAAKRLKQAGADIHLANRNGETPLHLAARYSRLAVVKWLCSFPHTLETRTKAGQTALEVARSWHTISPSENLSAVIDFLQSKEAGADMP